MKVNVLSNDDVMNKGKFEFLTLFNHYSENCKNTEFAHLFDYDNSIMKRSFILLKKLMLRYIITHIQDYLEQETNDISVENLKKFNKNLFHCIDKQINIKVDYVQMQTLWNLSVAELQSESIVESICSSLKKIYTPDRNELKQMTLEILIQLRLALSISKEQRDDVINLVIDKYHEQYPTQTKEGTKKKTERIRNIYF